MKSFKKLPMLLLMCAIILVALAQAQTQIGADIDGEAADDLNGNAVSLSGDGSRLATGAYLNDGNGSNAGYVRIHEWSGSAWVQVGADIIGETAGDWSGYSVSLSNDGARVAIGAIRNSDNGVNSGHVRIYDWSGSAWVQVGADIDGEGFTDESGYSVSLSSDGSRVAIGAVANNSDQGHVRIYEWNSTAWIQVGTDIDGEAAGDESGYSVSLSSDGSRVAIGARFNNGNTGHVRIYDWSGSAWLQVGTDIDGEASGDWSGYSVSLSSDGSRLAIGAVWNNSSAGHVRIYDWSGTAWVQVGADIEGEAAGDWSGHSVSLSGDGARVAIGAINNNGSIGQVRLYSWNSNAWVQYGTDIDGEAAGDQSGYSVSLSADGSRVAVGAPFNDGFGSDAGHVRVYVLCSLPTCDDGNPCTNDICDPVFGCLHIPSLDTDGDGICDSQDSCPALFGEIGDPCDDGIPCTENDAITAACECHGTPNDNLCDDNNVCNGTETCNINLGCLAGTPLICDDGNACTNDTCDPILGCQFVAFCGPANNECGNAQNLAVPTYPVSNSVSGTLFGASNNGGVACAASAAGGDVFYSFTLAQENHVGITVNPFAGADVVVEVLDGCAGTTIACINNAGAGGTENQLLQNLAAGSYKVRVHNAGGSPEPEASSYFLINVQQLPYAQVQDNPANPLYACNQSGFQLEDFIGASPQTTPGVLDYKWLVAEEGGGTLSEWQRGGPNYVSRCQWLGMNYGKTYNVFVKVLYNVPGIGPTWGVYQGDYQNPFDVGASACTISTASNVTPTEIRPNYTPDNAQGNDYGLCDFVVAYNVSNSENFRWRFDGNGTPGDLEDIIYTRGSGNPSVRLSWVNGLVPGTTYQVAVEVQVNGNWSGYSTVLPVTLALPPNSVQLRSSWCDGSATSYVLSESVCAAETYTFEFVDQSDASVHAFTSGNYVCFLSNLSPAVDPGVYDVRVKVSQGGIDGDFGGICVVTIGGPTAPGAGEAAARRDMIPSTSATLFPNPNAGKEVRVNLNGLSAGNHEVIISVYDIYGKEISTQGFGHEGTSLSRLVRFEGNLAMGMYMVQIVVDREQVAAERLIVK